MLDVKVKQPKVRERIVSSQNIWKKKFSLMIYDFDLFICAFERSWRQHEQRKQQTSSMYNGVEQDSLNYYSCGSANNGQRNK
jgi:hypothetical protein